MNVYSSTLAPKFQQRRQISTIFFTILITLLFLAAMLAVLKQPVSGYAAAASNETGIHGVKYHDIDGDGIRDPNEPGLAGWKIFLEGEGQNRTTLTDAAGRYWFMDLPAGQYAIGEEHQAGWVQTAPASGFYEVSYVPEQAIEGLDFGNFLEDESGIHGQKFRDINNNGRRDPDEPGIPGWEIRLEGANGTVRETITDIHGRYWFMDLDEGRYTVTEKLESGWVQTFPALGYYSFLYDPAQPIHHIDFGNNHTEGGGIHGHKFYDFNGDGENVNTDPGIPGWVIYLTDESGQVKETLTDDRGDFWFMDIPTGTYTVTEKLPDGWEQTWPPNGAYTFEYVPSQAIDGLLFGNREVEPGGIHGTKFHDKNGNGYWDDGEPGLAGWTIVMVDTKTNGEVFSQTAETDQAGHYWFMNIPADDYAIYEKPQEGWVQTFPPFEKYLLSFTPGQPIEHVNFGNFKPNPGEIHGLKFHDLNGNSKRDDNEPTLSGWLIHLQGETYNGEPVSLTTETNGDGIYWFMEVPPGVYMVSETVPEEWQQTFPRSGFHTAVVEPGSVVDKLDFGNWKPNPGEIHGHKFHDLNGNGRWDDNEPALSGWTIVIEGPNNFREEMVTDENGQYWFMDLRPGVYEVFEKPQETWQQTTPHKPRYYRIELGPGQVVEDADFGNWQPGPGSIHGVKFHDLNGNGIRDIGEPGLAGWTIVIEGEENFRRETVTDENGRYWFMELPPGRYIVIEHQKEGWVQSFPYEDGHHVFLEDGEQIHGLNFGNWQPEPGEIHGRKYNDLNGNGQQDANEPGLSGWTIVLQGRHGSQETTTGENGEYWFMDLRPGHYVLYEIQKEGWRPTNPPYGFHFLELESGTVLEGMDFGNWQPEPGEIHGTKFNDLNGNGQRENNEPGLPEWTIVVEGPNGLRRTTTTDANGNYWFMELPPGRYHVIEQVQAGWYQTYPYPNVHVIELEGGEVIDGVDFGNWQAEPGEIHGTKYYDVNGNGRRDANEPGLAGWTIYLDAADGTRHTTLTDAAGHYWFMDLAPGRYEVSERHKDGWLQTDPEQRHHVIYLAPNQVVDGVDFGNWDPDPGSVHGMKYYDANGNGQHDPDEAGLEGWNILLINANGRVYHTRTDENGNYWFENVLPGEYRVKEILTYGWQQTAPANGGYGIHLEPGQVIDGLDFGNVSDRTRDFCKIHWDLPFKNENYLETNIFVFNTSPSETKNYDLQLNGAPAGTHGAPSDGPDHFDILTTVPFSVTPNSVRKVPIRVYYPISFTAGYPGPAYFDAVLTNQSSNHSFGCYAAVWPVRNVQAQPQNADGTEIPENGTGVVEFDVINTNTPGDATSRAPEVVSYTIYAMTDGEEGMSSIISLNGLPAEHTVQDILTIFAGATESIKVNVSFVGESETLTTSDILLEIDIGNDGTVDLVTSAVVTEGESGITELYLPIVVGNTAAR